MESEKDGKVVGPCGANCLEVVSAMALRTLSVGGEVGESVERVLSCSFLESTVKGDETGWRVREIEERENAEELIVGEVEEESAVSILDNSLKNEGRSSERREEVEVANANREGSLDQQLVSEEFEVVKCLNKSLYRQSRREEMGKEASLRESGVIGSREDSRVREADWIGTDEGGGASAIAYPFTAVVEESVESHAADEDEAVEDPLLYWMVHEKTKEFSVVLTSGEEVAWGHSIPEAGKSVATCLDSQSLRKKKCTNVRDDSAATVTAAPRIVAAKVAEGVNEKNRNAERLFSVGFPGLRPTQNPYRRRIVEGDEASILHGRWWISSAGGHTGVSPVEASLVPRVPSDPIIHPAGCFSGRRDPSSCAGEWELCYPFCAWERQLYSAEALYRYYCEMYGAKPNLRVVSQLQEQQLQEDERKKIRAHGDSVSPPSGTSSPAERTKMQGENDPCGLHRIQSIDVSNALLKDMGFLPLLELLRWCSSLRELHLNGNDLTNEAVEWLAHCIVTETNSVLQQCSDRISQRYSAQQGSSTQSGPSSSTKEDPKVYKEAFESLRVLNLASNRLSSGALLTSNRIASARPQLLHIQLTGVHQQRVKGKLLEAHGNIVTDTSPS